MNARVRLTAISPLHIGGREQALSPIEFATAGGRCYMLSEDKLARALSDHSLLDSFLSAVSRQGRGFNMGLFLSEHSLRTPEFLQAIAAYSVLWHVDGQPRNPRPFIRNGLDEAYLPGTSLKGALRTALMFAKFLRMKERDPAAFEEQFIGYVIDRLQRFENEDPQRRERGWFRERTKRRFAEDLTMDVFEDFELEGLTRYNRRTGRREPRTREPHTDILRCLKVSDAAAFPRDSLQLCEVRVFSAGGGREIIMFVESVMPGATTEFTMTLDEGILADFAKRNADKLWFRSLDDVMKAMNEFADVQWQGEQAFVPKLDARASTDLRDFYQQQPANIRLGWGGGLIGTTMHLLLPPELQRRLRDDLFQKRNVEWFPKSKRIVIESQRASPLGWASIHPV